MITVIRCPDFAHSRQCSKVRLAGALTSGGKLSDKKRMCKESFILSIPRPTNLTASVDEFYL